MKRIGRNDPCPCGSGKKYKKCHLGKEDEMLQAGGGAFSAEMSARITALPEVNYGGAREMVEALDWGSLTGGGVGVRFVDLRTYHELDLSGRSSTDRADGLCGGLLINVLKTRATDPRNLYLAISPDVTRSALAHEIAHALDYLVGSRTMVGALKPVSYELGIPVEHLEHPHEFGYWLRFIREKLGVELDAEDTVIDFLYGNGMLIKGRDIEKQEQSVLRAQSERILKFLSQKGAEVDALICGRPGYIGKRSEADGGPGV